MAFPYILSLMAFLFYIFRVTNLYGIIQGQWSKEEKFKGGGSEKNAIFMLKLSNLV